MLSLVSFLRSSSFALLNMCIFQRGLAPCDSELSWPLRYLAFSIYICLNRCHIFQVQYDPLRCPNGAIVGDSKLSDCHNTTKRSRLSFLIGLDAGAISCSTLFDGEIEVRSQESGESHREPEPKDGSRIGLRPTWARTTQLYRNLSRLS